MTTQKTSPFSKLIRQLPALRELDADALEQASGGIGSDASFNNGGDATMFNSQGYCSAQSCSVWDTGSDGAGFVTVTTQGDNGDGGSGGGGGGDFGDYGDS